MTKRVPAVLLALAALAVPSTADAAVLFQDDFTGTAGTPPNPQRWTSFDKDTSGYFQTDPVRSANAFQDGNGRLVMRVKREPAGFTGAFGTTAYMSSSFIGTFGYGTGWPPQNVKFDAAVPTSGTTPLHFEMRANMPDAAGLWAGFWPMSTNRNTSTDGVWELDVAEQPTNVPTEIGVHQHFYKGGKDVQPWNGSKQISSIRRNWHVYSADVTRTSVTYLVDGQLIGRAPGVAGRFGILLDNKVAPAGTWAAGGPNGASVSNTDPGPWDLKIDYIRVTG